MPRVRVRCARTIILVALRVAYAAGGPQPAPVIAQLAAAGPLHLGGRVLRSPRGLARLRPRPRDVERARRVDVGRRQMHGALRSCRGVVRGTPSARARRRQLQSHTHAHAMCTHTEMHTRGGAHSRVLPGRLKSPLIHLNLFCERRVCAPRTRPPPPHTHTHTRTHTCPRTSVTAPDGVASTADCRPASSDGGGCIGHRGNTLRFNTAAQMVMPGNELCGNDDGRG